MRPNSNLVKINSNVSLIEKFINDIIITPKHTLTQWARITNQTPAAKIGYVGQHLASLITGIPGTGSGARGDDLSDGSEVKSCNKVDQVDKCKECGARVLRIEEKCSKCGSTNIQRRDDSKWLFSVRDEHELEQYRNLNRIVLLLMDYPNFETKDFKDIRISSFEIYPKEERMHIFNDLISNHYYNIYKPKQDANQHTNPMNLHPWSFQFYKCNPIKTFECIIKNIDTNPKILIDSNSYITPERNRDISISPVPMPSKLLKNEEWREMLTKADFYSEIKPLIDCYFIKHNNINELTKEWFTLLSLKEKSEALPYLNQKLRDYISMRPINNSVRQKEHYQRN